MRYMISIISIVSLLTACKSYDLKPVGEQVKVLKGSNSLEASIKQNSGNSNSPFSKCVFRAEVESSGGADRLVKGTADEVSINAQNDIANQAGLLGANTVFFRKSGNNNFIGYAYQCESIEKLLALQNTIDEEEKRKIEVERERKKAELFSKPHYWLICGKSPYSQVLPSITNGTLREFKPKAFEAKDLNRCGNEAEVKNMIAANFGIACICTDKQVKLNREKIEAEFGGAEVDY